jgi:hypothetical protein
MADANLFCEINTVGRLVARADLFREKTYWWLIIQAAVISF